MTRSIRIFTLAMAIAFVLLIPQTASTQGLGAREDNTALQGTNLTYYPQPNFGQCQADCANNGNCKGFTWIQAGTYKAGDAAMCYLLSTVTGRASTRGHFSAIKGGGGGGKTGYIGCYKDTSAFDLDGFLVRSRSNTPQSCIETCRAKGFAYAGVQYGESCLCGNSYGKYGTADNCNMKCTGDSGQICGGINANSVYGTGISGGGGGCQGANYSITSPGTVRAGEAISVRFTAPSNHSRFNWIGIFQAGVAPKNWLAWEYVPDDGQCSGTMKLSGQRPGQYDLYYFLDQGYDKVAARASLTVR